MTHPFQSLPPGTGKYVLWTALVLYLVAQIAFTLSDPPLDTPEVHKYCDSFLPVLCYGIIGYEFAHTVDNSRAILESWDKVGAKPHAGFSLGIDYVYILGYSNLIALACVWTIGVLKKRAWFGSNLGTLLAWGAWLAGLLDATENVGLLVQLFNGAASEWAFVAWLCASIKFVLILLGGVYALYGVAGWLVDKARPL